MSDQIADLYANIRANMTGWTSGLNQGKADAAQFESHSSGVFTKVAGAVAALGVTAGAVSFFKGAISEAREAAKVGADTALTIKDTGAQAWTSAKHIGDLATSLSNYAGIDDEAIQANENILLTFKSIQNAGTGANAVFDRASKATVDLSQKFGGMKQSSIQVGKALEDPVKGITALGRAGVTFDETQKKMIAHMVESGDKIGAQKLILTAIEGQVGGLAGAMADPWDRIIVVWKNVEEAVGTALLPVLGKLLTWGADLLPKALGAASAAFGFVEGAVKAFIAAFRIGDGDITSSGFAGKMERLGYLARVAFDRIRDGIDLFLVSWHHADDGITSSGINGRIEQFGIIARHAWDTAREAAAQAWAVLGPIIQQIQTYLGDHLRPILIAIGAAFAVLAAGGVIGLVVSAIGGLISIVVALVGALLSPVVIIGALVAALVYAYEESSRFRAALSAMKEAAIVTFGWIRDNVVPVVVRVAQQIEQSFGHMIAWSRSEWPKIKVVVQETIAFIHDRVLPVVKQIIDYIVAQSTHLIAWIQVEWPKISEAVTHVWNVARAIVIGVLAAIGAAVMAGVTIIVFVWDHAHNQIMAIATAAWNVMKALISTTIEIFSHIIDFWLNVINGDWGKAWGDIKDILSAVWALIGTIVSNAITIVWNVITGALALIGGLWSAAWNGIQALLAWAWAGMVSAVVSGVTSIVGWFISLPGAILGALGDLAGLLVFKGLQLISGLKNGAVSAAEGLWGWLRSVPGAITGVFWDAANFLSGIGGRIIDGLVDGIKGAIHKVTDILGSVTDLIPSWKGPPSRDATLLHANGRLIMGGLVKGLQAGYGDVQRYLSGVTASIGGGASIGVTVAPYAATNTIRHEVVQRVIITHEGDIQLTGTAGDIDKMASQLARPIRDRLLKIGATNGRPVALG